MRTFVALALLATLSVASCATVARNPLAAIAPRNVATIEATRAPYLAGVDSRKEGEFVITGIREGWSGGERCTLQGEQAAAMASALAEARRLPSPSQHTEYGYDIRISLVDGAEVAAILPMTLNAGSSAAIVVDGRMLLLDKPYFVRALELIESAGC